MSVAVAQLPEIVTDYKSRDAWLEARRAGIGGSEAAALYGLSPFTSRYSLWAEKAGVVVPPPLEGERLHWGRLLEGPVATRYEEVTGRTVWAASAFAIAQHPRIGCLFATPDRYVITSPDKPGRGQLQIKTTGTFMADDWKDGPPEHVQIQVQHELAVTGRDWSSIAVLIGGNQFRYWDVDRNEGFIAEHEIQCQMFWEDVRAKRMPELDGSEATYRTLAMLHPLDNGETIELAPEAADWWARYADLSAQRDLFKDQLKVVEKDRDAVEARLRAAIGANSFGRIPGGPLLSLKHTTRKGYAVESCTYRTLRLVKEPERKAPKRNR